MEHWTAAGFSAKAKSSHRDQKTARQAIPKDVKVFLPVIRVLFSGYEGDLGCRGVARRWSERRGATGEEGSADRLPNCCLRFRNLRPHRGVPAGAPRAWLRGGEKHCHRVAICRG